jgi:flavorubredoxin
MARVDEIAADVYRISIFVSQFNLQFNHFLIRDDEPLLFHAGFRSMFPEVKEAVASLLEPSRIRWVGFSHFESDECGALNAWLETAPAAEAVCSLVGALVSVNDFAVRPARGMAQDDVLATGKYRFRFCSTAHLPHGWDAGLLFEETQRMLLCSDLFHHSGDVEPLTGTDVVERSRQAMVEMQASPLANYLPFTPQTSRILERLASLQPKTLAIQHGSSFSGDGARALRALAPAFRDAFGG